MWPRLHLLRELLAENGAIFVSIDDNEQHHLRMMMDEIFGAENFVANIVWQKRYVSNVTAGFLSDMHDHVVCYAKTIDNFSVNKLPELPNKKLTTKTLTTTLVVLGEHRTCPPVSHTPLVSLQSSDQKGTSSTHLRTVIGA